MAGLLIGFSVWHILAWKNKYNKGFMDSVRGTRGVPLFNVLYGALAGTYPIALTVYHLGLMGTAQTTREYLQSRRFQRKDRHRPFTQGNFFKNWVAVLVRPRPPTYLRFKEAYSEGDQRYSDKKVRLGQQQQGSKEAVEMRTIPQSQGTGSAR